MRDGLKTWIMKMPGRDGLPFATSPECLYSIPNLYKGFDPNVAMSYENTFDKAVYRWTRTPDDKVRKLTTEETIAARLHDTVMDQMVAEFINPTKSVTIGFMGGHDISRKEEVFARVAQIARELRRRGFMIVTGGGPGLMEAANFGAFMAPYGDDNFRNALDILRRAPSYGQHNVTDEQEKASWVAAAADVRRSLLGSWDASEHEDSSNLGMPTWCYGAEPPNLFATVVSKYFFNSLREDGLVSVANGGLVFGKGDAGTVQEVFQNATYNYYRDAEIFPTPMVFFDSSFWNPTPSRDTTHGATLDSHRKPVFPLIQKLASESANPFEKSLMLSDSPDEIVEFITLKNADKLNKMRHADQRLAIY